ncbi:MAG TPA: MFS transporter [Verrucomicrobiales bacterium]|nr:MFS transporter [Verrucomicrobiales bacterium]
MTDKEQKDNRNGLLKSWRYRIFASTWLCYAGLYFCRKPFSIVKADLGDALEWDASFLGLIGTVYLLTYAIGQFVAGLAGTALGPRLILMLGMSGSILANVVFGISDSAITFAIFMGVLGFSQSTGWGCTVGTMATWFQKHERGRVMGLWSTCYAIGGVGSVLLASKVLGAYGFRYSFFAGSLVMLAILVFFAFNHRNRPEDLGLSLPKDEEDLPDSPYVKGKLSLKDRIKRLGWDKNVITTLMLVGIFYFFVKFIRYALWSWVPYLLTKNYELESDDAGYMSALFDLFGIVGVIAAGWISDKLMKSRRTGVSLLFLFGMFASCGLLYFFGQNSLLIFGISISLIGFFLFGPDALMTGAGAQDIGNARGATLSAGIINGMGAFGAVAQELIIGRLYDDTGGDIGPIFMLLLGSAACAAICLSIVRFTKISDV